MYWLLRRYAPETLADVLMGLWYALLFFLVLYFAFEPQAEFNYLTL